MKSGFVLLSILVFTGTIACAQTIIRKDPVIEKMVAAVSSDSLKGYVHSLIRFKTRHTLSVRNNSKEGIGAAQKWVLDQLQQFAKNSGGRLSAYLDTITYQPDGKRVNKSLTLGNVVAVLKGTAPKDKRIFMMTAHLDSRRTDVMDAVGVAPGANDDGSGVAAIMECARVMSREAFPATIIFVVTSGEEQGLLGATFMAGKVATQNWPLEALLNNDIIGSNNSNETNTINNTEVRVFSEGIPATLSAATAREIRSYGLENDGAARQLARYFKEVGERYVDNMTVKLIYRNDRFLRGGDHSPFVEKGYTAVRITEMNENFTHQHQDIRTQNGIQYGDLPEFMDFEYLRKNTALNLATLANLARAPAKPQQPGYIMKGLENSTTLQWDDPATGSSSGFYLLMRETSSPVWQKKFFTKNKSITVPYSKDNYFFAVQAVNTEGNESLPVVVKPASKK
ncbi:M20/M25/M40 family metallo-hydrolase [Niabella soli]|uniref:Peptidase M28 n=1 Tax=Niabella soli DSM 19437 TaxID=929713 RepID=W0F5T0_9BACT|nr:M20/M25/M40 family metallo-hydrolase [Niabella soli]AHF16686.1 peptidase M28 [Niabella soli DSM 19437]